MTDKDRKCLEFIYAILNTKLVQNRFAFTSHGLKSGEEVYLGDCLDLIKKLYFESGE